MCQMDAKHGKAIDTEQRNAERRYQDLEEKFRDLEIRYQKDVLEHKTLIDQLKEVLHCIQFIYYTILYVPRLQLY